MNTVNVKVAIEGQAAKVSAPDGTPLGAMRASFAYLHNALCALGYVATYMQTGFVRYVSSAFAGDHTSMAAGRASLRPVLCIGRTQGGECYVKRCSPDDSFATVDGAAWRGQSYDKHAGRRLGYVGNGDPLTEAATLAAALAVAGIDSGAPWRAVLKALDADLAASAADTSATDTSAADKPRKRQRRAKVDTSAADTSASAADTSANGTLYGPASALDADLDAL